VIILETLKVCERHADRLRWAMLQLQAHFPLTGQSLSQLNDMEIAILDQFSTRFAKLQDLMGASLFPAVLELTKEPSNLRAFIDKLHQLEKIGALSSAEDWLLLREVRNSFSHDYPDDPELQAQMLNHTYPLANNLLKTFAEIQVFIQPYL